MTNGKHDNGFEPPTIEFGRTFDVLLQPEQQREAFEFGRLHQDLCRRRRQQDRHFDRGRTSDETKEHGMATEYATCIILRLDPREALFGWRPTGDEGYDIFGWTKRIQVKGTRYRAGKLMMAPALFRKAFDHALLVIESPPRYRLVGYLPKATYGRRAGFDPNARYQPAISVSQADLYPPEWLEPHCRHGDAWLAWWLTKIKP